MAIVAGAPGEIVCCVYRSIWEGQHRIVYMPDINKDFPVIIDNIYKEKMLLTELCCYVIIMA